MAIKKSELYSSLWKMCDELRGGMEASEYKDYVLIMLFIKYISDKYAGQPFAAISVPQGSSFADMIALKGKDTIGDDINKKIIGPIEQANPKLGTIRVDFDNPEKLGTGKEKVERLTNLITIFEKPELNFAKNKAEGDDILGDAYEYLMRNFATESGKSKGQFYTPAEVSRIMAKIIGINSENSTPNTTIYDPTCGSGSLLLKVADEAEKKITIYGQEKESATAGLARMNMVLHDCPTAEIACTGNSTLSDPQFKNDNDQLRQFDFVVANPPFSSKNWLNGIKFKEDGISEDFDRFNGFGIPPAKNGDYAFLLHIIRSLKSKGKAAVILPHGVLFRGNAEAEIRKNLIDKGYIKGIIGLPTNLFYGTGIPACLILIDKENAANRKAIYMMDASKGFMKDGPKNRLRDQDIHKIVDFYNRMDESDTTFARIVPITEIISKDYNLNIPRYIDSQVADDLHDIDAHLNGGIPQSDIEMLSDYWSVYPTLKKNLFTWNYRPGYAMLSIPKKNIKQTIYQHPEFKGYSTLIDKKYETWKSQVTVEIKALKQGFKPKHFIYSMGESILSAFDGLTLFDKYDIYQHLMTYWSATMQDDMYLLSDDGWDAAKERTRLKKESKGKYKDVEGIAGIEGRLIPTQLIIDMFFVDQKEAIQNMEADIESNASRMEEIESEQTEDDDLLNNVKTDKGKVTKALIEKRIKALKKENDSPDELNLITEYLSLIEKETKLKASIKAANAVLEKDVWDQYPLLTVDDIHDLLINRKWMAYMDDALHGEMNRISQRLTGRIGELADRYEIPLPQLKNDMVSLEAKVNAHLAKMGFKI
jgi:type I restriction enzyme M protein